MLLQENEGESSMSWERFSHLYDLMQRGNKAYRDNRFEEVELHSFITTFLAPFIFFRGNKILNVIVSFFCECAEKENRNNK